ncbi:hypothetical protein AVEN_206466-1 [Araneus ventricosus]|uniref:Uncharacterized protein n=1 Tax=Araneus ventricosus TaxID=182803 RepID=A0A4Y2G219_ARAVE|nr:hypothetical protein AVEN_206466-1 [Araneus ventricosus]
MRKLVHSSKGRGGPSGKVSASIPDSKSDSTEDPLCMWACCTLNNGPYAPFGFESIKKQLWRNKQSDWPISDSEIKAVLSQLFKTDQWLPPAGHVSEDVTSHA